MSLTEGANQGSEAPNGSRAHGEDEHYADQFVRGCAFAPTLEHGDDSNDKEQDGDHGENLEPHKVA